MRTYYYRGITCPNCHEPHVNGGAIEILDKSSLRCTSCGAKFKKTINLHSSELFPETLNYIIEREGKNAKQYLSRIPLVWKIEPNIIEQAYIDWLSPEKKGFFLITWSWHDVRFIPLLVFEYLMNNPGKRAVVIGNYSNYKEDKIEITPSTPYAFSNMIYTVNAESVSSEIKKEIKNLDKKLILKKEKVVDVIYKKIGANKVIPRLCHKTLLKCKNEIRNEDSELRMGLLRKLTVHKLNHEPNTEEVNKNGIWDVSLVEQKRWTGDLKYKKIWLWDVLVNSTRSFPCKSTIPYLFDGEVTDEKPTHKDIRLHFLSSEPDVSTVLENVQEISPDILIIENADEIISDSRFGGEKSKTLLQFLNKCSVKTVLMFSTNPDIRQFYKLNDNESLFRSIEVVPHTWDSPHIFNNLPDGNESKHPNPVSSNISQIIKEKIRKITPEYVIVDSYNTIVETLDNCFLTLTGK